jgi:hypothetical protein
MTQTRTGRLDALDFTKGALVLIMVLYHWLNYFVGDLDYRYLRFLTPSFLFITGFLISYVYLSRPNVDNRVAMRLLTRGFKLLALFAVLNIGKAFLIPGVQLGPTPVGPLSAETIAAVMVVGPPDTQKVVSFYILIPIGYLLILSAALIRPYKFQRYTFHIVCLLLLCCVAVLSFGGLRSPNLQFVTLGMIGVVSGFVPMERIDRLSRRYYLLAVAYGCYVAAISVWNVPFALLVVGVCLSLLALYLVGSTADEYAGARAVVTLLGRYSLFGYIAQIAVLQFLSATSRHFALGRAGVYASIIAAFVLTILAVEVVAFAKERSLIVERLYRAAFA